MTQVSGRDQGDDAHDIEFNALRRVVAVSARINAGQDLDETLQAITDGIVEAIGFGAAGASYRRRDGAHVCAAVTGPPQMENLLGVVTPSGESERWIQLGESWGALQFISHEIALREFAEGRGLEEIWKSDAEPSDDPDAWHPYNILYAPLYSAQGVRVGGISVDLPPGGRKPSQLLCEMLELFAVQAGIAIANAILREDLRLEREKLEHHATRDWLTGLYNRRVFIERIEDAIEEASDYGAKTTLLFCDLNHFKQINDTYGHSAGDGVLQEIAKRLQGLVRRTDCVARIGGDEFVILATNTDDTLAGRVRAAISVPLQTCPTAITASIGQVSVLGTEDPETVLSLADLAMYAEKQLR